VDHLKEGKYSIRTKTFPISLITISLILSSLILLTPNASAMSWSSDITVFSHSDWQYLDGDLAKGTNYYYAFSDANTNPDINVYIKRSLDGVIWSNEINVYSGLSMGPRGGFCVYPVLGSDNIIISISQYVSRSCNNGSTFSPLSSLPYALDYIGVATNTSMNPAISYDDDIYIAGIYGTNGIRLMRSVNNGGSWSAHSVTASYSNCPVLMRDDSQLYCFYMLAADLNAYVTSSADWGKTWSASVKIYSHTQTGAIPIHAQYIDDQRCLLTLHDVSTVDIWDYSLSRGVFGYYWFSNNTFQQIGYETGSTYNNPNGHAYTGIAFNDALGVNYTSLWCYCVTPSYSILKTHYTHDSGLNITSGSDITPPSVMICSPTRNPTFSTTSPTINLTGTASDNVGLTEITWHNVASNLSGTAVGTTDWNITDVALVLGSNIITITAHDEEGNIGTDTINLFYDLTNPTVTITSPTNNPTYSTGSSIINLGGTSYDNVNVINVTWYNAGIGAGGTATGSTNWTNWNALGIPLANGINLITIISYDAAGNKGIDTLEVNSTTTEPWSLDVYRTSGVRYVDADIFKGENYFYAFADEYSSSAHVYVKRSVDGLTWAPPSTIWSSANYPRGGFCVYTVAGVDHIICTIENRLKKSIDNGGNFTPLTSFYGLMTLSTVATNPSMNPGRAYDNIIYVAGTEEGSTGISLVKSDDNGASWAWYGINGAASYAPVLMRDNYKLYCIYTLDYDKNVYVKNSSDWGLSWGSATKIYTHCHFGAYPGHAQYIDSQRCLLTINDIMSNPFSDSSGIYGYFWYWNNTFQPVGFETGTIYNNPEGHSYSGLAFNDTFGVNYTSIWCNYIDGSNYAIKTHYLHYTGLNITPGLDNTPPQITITSPAASSSYATVSSTVCLGGTAIDNAGLSIVTWNNTATNESGTALGTTSWTTSDIALIPGNNLISVTVCDTSGNSANDSILINLDQICPICIITSSTCDPGDIINSFSVSIVGTSSDNVAVTEVTWLNAATGSKGQAYGTSSWEILDIFLKTGSNLITITAHDAAGNIGNDTINVTCTAVVSWSSDVTVFSTSGIKYLDVDLAKGSYYLYAYTDVYDYPGNVYVKRSVDGFVWSTAVTAISGLNFPHGGFCVYTVSGSDHVICSALGNIVRSTNNGTTFSALTTLGASLDYTNVATNTSMDSSIPYDNNIYVVGNIGISGIYLRKSVDNGNSWSSSYQITNTHSYTPVLIRDNTKLYCFYSLASDNNVYVKNSTDWGKTWGIETKVYIRSQYFAWPGHTQTINLQKCLLTIGDAQYPGPDFRDSRGIYGYYWFSNNTYQIIGYETGIRIQDPHSYAGIAFIDNLGVNYTSMWGYHIEGVADNVVKTHYSHNRGISFAPEPPPPILKCTITSPTSSSTMATGWHMIYLMGSASDDTKVTNVIWSNSLGGSGIAYMTPQFGAADVTWQSRGNIMLYDGVNVITVTAYDDEGNNVTDVLTVTYNTGPTVTITAPTSNPTMATGWHMINLRGTATDDFRVVSVTWTNSLGGSGVAYMTPQWGGLSVTWQSRGNVLLYPGDNIITVIAYDNTGKTATDVLTVTYTGP
jgi:hypothetical protein